MSNSELQPITHRDYYNPRGGEHIGTFAEGRVNQYDSADPRLEIDVIVNNHIVRIIVDENPIFDYHPCKLDKIEIYKSHHKRLILQIGESVQDDNGIWEHEVYSPSGLMGHAFSKKNGTFGFYIASLFYKDPEILKRAKGHGRFDKPVQEYLEKEFGIQGIFK